MSDIRLTEVESKLAFAEDLLDSLNQTVIQQQAQIDSLQQQLRLLNQRLRDLSQSSAPALSPGEEIPPHY